MMESLLGPLLWRTIGRLAGWSKLHGTVWEVKMLKDVSVMRSGMIAARRAMGDKAGLNKGIQEKMNLRGMAISAIVLGGLVLLALLLVTSVELLRLFPLTDVASLSTAYWQSTVPAHDLAGWLHGEAGFYWYVVEHTWVLLVEVPLVLLLMKLAVDRLEDPQKAMFLEQIHVQQQQIGQLTASEEDSAQRWERTEQGMEAMLQQSGELWLVLDEHKRVSRWNEAAATFFAEIGGKVGALEGLEMADLWPGFVNTLLYRTLSELSPAKVQVFNAEVQVTREPARYLHVWMWPLGREIALLMRDVSHRHHPEGFRENAEALAKQLVQQAAQPTAVLDLEGRYTYVGNAWSATLGIDASIPLEGQPHMQAVPGFPSNFGYALQQVRHGQVVGKDDESRTVNGQEELLGWHLRPWLDVDGKPAGCVFSVVNNTELLRLRAQIKDVRERENLLAYSDMLTGLPNRQLFNDRLNMALAQAYRQLGKVALLFLDLDGFKAVNDTLGHDAGDLLLKQVALRLKGCIRQTDTVARLGGDEFTMILHVRERGDAEQVAAKILQVIREPYDLAGVTGKVGTSIGIALYPQDATQGAELVRMADNSMYAAKQGGKNTWRFFDALPKT